MKKWLLAALVCTLAVTGCSKYKQVSDLPETDETTEKESMSGETTAGDRTGRTAEGTGSREGRLHFRIYGWIRRLSGNS